MKILLRRVFCFQQKPWMKWGPSYIHCSILWVMKFYPTCTSQCISLSTTAQEFFYYTNFQRSCSMGEFSVYSWLSLSRSELTISWVFIELIHCSTSKSLQLDDALTLYVTSAVLVPFLDQNGHQTAFVKNFPFHIICKLEDLMLAGDQCWLHSSKASFPPPVIPAPSALPRSEINRLSSICSWLTCACPSFSPSEIRVSFFPEC